jgi:hypothetical protein
MIRCGEKEKRWRIRCLLLVYNLQQVCGSYRDVRRNDGLGQKKKDGSRILFGMF